MSQATKEIKVFTLKCHKSVTTIIIWLDKIKYLHQKSETKNLDWENVTLNYWITFLFFRLLSGVSTTTFYPKLISKRLSLMRICWFSLHCFNSHATWKHWLVGKGVIWNEKIEDCWLMELINKNFSSWTNLSL